MKKTLYTITAIGFFCFASCNKNDNNATPNASLEQMELAAVNHFATNIALATYADLETAGGNLNIAVLAFVSTPSETTLSTCKQAWKNLRTIWETSEGFLFGPIEDNEYDPKMDTWPTDYTQMNILLSDETNHPLNLADIQSLDYSLRGFHPIEYMLWGVNSAKTANEFTPREIQYLTSLTQDVKMLCASLHADWTSGYADKVLTTAKGSTVFTTYQDLFITLLEGMIGICNEVGKSDENTGKIYEPFIAKDSNIVESPYSENSMEDFKNNITGAYGIYIGKYAEQGTGLSNIVASMNKDLDNQVKQKFQNAINAFTAINGSFEQAIFNQRVQLQDLMNAIGAVRDILEDELKPFLLQNIQN